MKSLGSHSDKVSKGMETAKNATWLGLGGSVLAGLGNIIWNPKDGFIANKGADIMTTLANMNTEAGVDSGWQGFYKFFEKLANFIESFTGEGSMKGLTNWAKRGMGQTPTESASDTSAQENNLAEGPNALPLAAGATTVVGGKLLTKSWLKAIPLAGTVVTGLEVAQDFSGHAKKGELSQAFTRAIGGGGEALGYIGGALTSGIGNAWNEAIIAGANGLGVDTSNVQKSTARQLATGVYNFATDGPQ